MEILTGEQMRRVDRYAIDDLGIPGLELMEAAGRGVARALLEDYPDLADSGIVILCGKGNNGGDGFVVARHLAERGVRPRVLLLAHAAGIAGDAAVNLRAARDAGIEVRELPDDEAWAGSRSLLEDSPLLLDALLGTGVRGGARGLLATVIQHVNAADCRVASVDLPSGINADLTEVEGHAIEAERTYTLCRPKLALALRPSSAHCGIWRVIPIGIPDEAVAAAGSDLEWLDLASAGALLGTREPDAHKGTYGHVLIVAGSPGKSGAAVLAARGALRSGVGLVTVATNASNQERVAVQQAEIMTEPLDGSPGAGLGPAASRQALDLLRSRDALVLGPGLGTTPGSCRAIGEIVAGCDVPSVIDADGLNALALEDRSARSWTQRPAQVVLTPHPGEAARLLGSSAREVQADRLGAARQLAGDTGTVVVLKGHRSLVAAPDGRVAVNASGNPGMATAGSGDVLSGIVGTFLARGFSAWDAARLAVFAHGAAGDLAAGPCGQEGLIASDIVNRLPEAFGSIVGTARAR